MKRDFAVLLTIGVIISAGVLIWLDHQAVSGWQTSAASLADRRARETADLLLRAVSRDMRGAQTSILSSPRWDEFMLMPPYDVRTVVASGFARYPYPESFFAWREDKQDVNPVFFNRPDRTPSWIPGDGAPVHFPVIVAENPKGADALMKRIRADGMQGRTFSTFETTLGKTPYQIVARLIYGDAMKKDLRAVFGFTVNLDWVRTQYFRELIRQVSRISATEGRFELAVADSKGDPVTGSRLGPERPDVVRRSFPMTFFDPALIELDPPADLSRELWTVQIGLLDDPALREAVRGANRTRIIAAIAGISLGLGLVLTVRAARTTSRLTEMRSEFVSTVTHELKTPIATIRAIGDTVVSGRVPGESGFKEYAGLLVQEAKRLERLVENLLAFARITDVTEVYAFEAVPVETLVDDVLENFRAQLKSMGFNLVREIPPHIPAVKGDKTALELMLDNLVDNAIRYSRDERRLIIEASTDDKFVALSVRDHGIGIPEDEVDKVTRRFFRGKHAGTGGTGLGLAIVRRIVDDHGGSMSIHSEVGVGTTVTVRLPIAKS